MKTRYIMMLLVAMTTAGCATPAIIDTLPPDSPKGYVSFINVCIGYQAKSGYSVADIYSINDTGNALPGDTLTNDVLEWSFSDWSVAPPEVRLAKKPGSYHFSIRFDHRFPRVRKDITVLIKKGMVTPVKLALYSGGYRDGSEIAILRLLYGNPVPADNWNIEAAKNIEWLQSE